MALADVAPMGFKRLPGGTFTMGSPESEPGRSSDERLHSVELSGFEIGTTEVTLAQWRAVMGDAPNGCKVHCVDDHPIEAVHWEMAIEFLNRLTDRENLGRADAKLSRCYEQRDGAWAWVQGCTGYRLPSEAEWEYAARAGTTTA